MFFESKILVLTLSLSLSLLTAVKIAGKLSKIDYFSFIFSIIQFIWHRYIVCALSFPLNTQVSETDRLCWNLLFVGSLSLSLSLSLLFYFLVLLGFSETKVQAIPPFLQPYWVGGGGKSVGACTTTLLEKDITRM